MKQLPIPPKAEDDKKSFEILRAWITSDGNMHVSIELSISDDHRTWGIALADFLQHITQGIEELGGPPASVTKEDIIEMFLLEVEAPTDEAKGQFYD